RVMRVVAGMPPRHRLAGKKKADGVGLPGVAGCRRLRLSQRIPIPRFSSGCARTMSSIWLRISGGMPGQAPTANRGPWGKPLPGPLESSALPAARTEMSEQKPAPETAEDFRNAALEYHRLAPAGKIKVAATKPMVTQ